MTANSQPLLAATDVCNTHLGSASGLLQNLKTAHFSLCCSFYISTSLFFVLLFVWFGGFSLLAYIRFFFWDWEEKIHWGIYSGWRLFPSVSYPAFPLDTFPSAQNFKPGFSFYRNLWEAGLNPNGGDFSKLKVVNKAVWNSPSFLSGKITVHFDNFPQKMISEANEYSWRGTKLLKVKNLISHWSWNFLNSQK